MAAGEEEQRAAKRRILIDALERIGKLKDADVGACVPSPHTLGYRNKLELAFGEDGRLGFHAAHDPATLVDVPACAIADPRLSAPLRVVREALRDGRLGRRRGRLVLRASGSRPDVLVGFRDGGEPFDEAPAIAEALAASVPGLCGVVRMIAPPGRRGGTRVETIQGRPFLEEEILGVSYRVPAATFLQVNAAAAEGLAESVLDEAGRPARVTELYGGIGAIGLALAARGATVTIVDADGEAVACGREASLRAGRSALFVRSDVLPFLRAAGEGPELVIADPPRTGFGPGVAEALVARRPARIALVSCDPATLARDLARLVASGYALDRVTPHDLFPQTAHVEAVAWLTRRG
jgi:23S rRNA (uracil1939-C5)-methyltransferase